MKNAIKYLFAAEVAAVLAGGAAAECADGVCMLPPAQGEAEFSVVLPVPEAAIAPIAAASRLKSLDGKSAFIVTGDKARNKEMCLPGGGFTTIKIQLPKAWDSLMAERGYEPFEKFHLP